MRSERFIAAKFTGQFKGHRGMYMGIQALRGARLGWVLLALGGVSSGIAGIAGIGVAHAAPLPARLTELLSSRTGEMLLIESRAGRELTEQLLGRKLMEPGRLGPKDLRDLRTRLERADAESWRPEFESRLERAQEALESALKGRPRRLSDRGRIIDDVTSKFLEVRADRFGKIEFLGDAGAGSFAASRGAMVTDISSARRGVAPVDKAFEAGIPVEKGSMASRWGRELTDELAEIEHHFLRINELDNADGIARGVRKVRGGSSQDVNLHEMLEYVVAQREAMSRRFSKMAERYRTTDKGLAELLDRTASEINLTSKELNRIEARAHELSIVDYEGPRSADPVMGYVHRLFGQIGEIKVAVRLNAVIARGLKVQDLGRFMGEGKLADAARARLQALRATHDRELGKELDLLMEDGWLWSEVKNYGEAFGPGHRSYDKVITQAELTLDIRRLLEGDPIISRALKAAGKKIRLRTYFIKGVTEDGARELERLGIEVFGPRVGDHAFIKEAA